MNPSSSLLKLNENGLQERENSILYTKKPLCNGNGGNFISVGMVDIEPALLIIAWGSAFAILFLVLEGVYHKLENYIRRNRISYIQ